MRRYTVFADGYRTLTAQWLLRWSRDGNYWMLVVKWTMAGSMVTAESRAKKRKTHSIVDCGVIPIIDFDYSYFVQNP